MAVEGVLEFFGKSLDAQSLGQKLLVQVDDFVTEVVNLTGLRTDNSKFAFQIGNRVVENSDILKSLLVLVFTLAKSCLQNFNLLVQKCKFVISANELSSKYISLVNNFSDFLLFDFVLVISFFNNES